MSAAAEEISEGTERVTVSLPRHVARALRIAAEEDHTSVSGWVAESIHDRLLVLGMKAYITDYEKEFGEITDEEIAAAERRMDERSAPWR